MNSTDQNLFDAVFGGVEGEARIQAYVESLYQNVAAETKAAILVRHFHRIVDGAMQSVARQSPAAYGDLARGFLRLEGLRALTVLRHLIALGNADAVLSGEITGMVMKLEALARMIRRILVPGMEAPLSYTQTFVLVTGGTPLYPDVPSNSEAVVRILLVVMRDYIGADLGTPQTMFADPFTLSNDPVGFGGVGSAIDVIPAGMTIHEVRMATLGGAAGGAGAGAVPVPVGMYGGGEGGAHPLASVGVAAVAAVPAPAPRTPERARRGGAGAAVTPGLFSTPVGASITTTKDEAPGAPCRPRRRRGAAAAPAVHPAYAQHLLGPVLAHSEDTSLAHLHGLRAQLFPGAVEHDITAVDAAVVVGHMAQELVTSPEQQVDCALCMGTAEIGTTTVVRPGCCHNAVYCRGCACQALRLRNTCPFCVKCMVCHASGCNSYHHL